MFIRLYRLAFWLAALFALVMASLPKPPQLPGDPSDKVQHILAFAVLAVLASLAFRHARPLRVALGLSAFGALIEFIQMIPQLHRDASWLDWMADTTAVIVVVGAVWAYRRAVRAMSANRKDDTH